MTRIAATLVVLCSLAATIPNDGVSASTPERPAGDVDILINDVPQPRYFHQGRWYVEALKGREYAIRLRNPYGVRVAVALSVDGLNSIDARETTAVAARKWVLEPHQTVTIRGWQTSSTEARRFEFTNEEQSYARAMGKAANLGVMSAVYFRERPRRVIAEAPREPGRARQAPAPEPAAAKRAAPSPQPSAGSADEYAATGMGRATDHAVTQVWLDLEDTPAQSIDIRYEFRPQLIRLGILPESRVTDPLQRREGARGFEPRFAPVPPRKK
jgi:hypothetical protein